MMILENVIKEEIIALTEFKEGFPFKNYNF